MGDADQKDSPVVLHVASVTSASSNRLALQYGYTSSTWRNELLHLQALPSDMARADEVDGKVYTLPHRPRFRDNDSVPVRRLRSLIRRVSNTCAMFWGLWRSRADLLHAHENSSLWAVAFWSVVLGRPAVWDPHDYFHESERSRSRLGGWNIKEFLERRLVKRKVPILVVSDGMRRIYGEMYSTAPVFTIRNYSADFRERDAISSASDIAYRRRELSHGRIRIVYFGLIDAGRLELPLLSTIGRNARIQFDIYGIYRSARYQTAVEELLVHEGISNIQICGPYSPQSIGSILERYHFALFPYPTTTVNHRICLPNKFFQCMEAGLPVLSTDMEELDGIITRHGLGSTYSSHDAVALRNTLSDLSVNDDSYETLVEQVLAYRSEEMDYPAQRSALLDAYHLATGKQ